MWQQILNLRADIQRLRSSIAGLPVANMASVRIMHSGDSITEGGDSNQTDLTDSYRGVCWERLRSVRGNLQLLGTNAVGLFDNRGALPGSNAPGNVRLGDWHVAATGGFNLSQINGQRIATEALQGVADVYTLLGGENDIQQGLAAGHSTSTIAAAVLAGIQTYIQGALTSNPNAYVLVLDLTPHGVGLASYVASNLCSNAINASLPAFIASFNNPRVRLVQAGSLLGTGPSPFISSDGQHPGAIGDALIGVAVANAILAAVGVGGAPYPRPIMQRLLYPRLVQTTTGIGYIADPSLQICPQGQESFSMGMFLNPSALASSNQVVFWTGPDVAPTGFPDGSGVWVIASPPFGGAPAQSLGLYIGGVAQYAPNDALAVNTPTLVMLSFDNARGEARLYAARAGANGPGPSNGIPVVNLVSTITGIPKFTMPTPARVNIGALLGSNTVPGLKGDLWIARNYVATIDDLEKWACEGSIPQTATALYQLKEGTGTSLNPAPAQAGLQPVGAIGAGSTWSAAGAVAEPWARGYDTGAAPDVETNANPIGAAAIVTYISAAFTPQTSGRVRISAVFSAIDATAGDELIFQLYRNPTNATGAPGGTAIGPVATTTAQSASISGTLVWIDTVPINAAATWGISVASGGAHNVSLGSGTCSITLEELPSPT